MRYIQASLITVLHTLIAILAIYSIWGWITINDIRKICAQKNLDFEKVIPALPPSYNVKINTQEKKTAEGESKPGSFELKANEDDYGLSHYLIPFLVMPSFTRDEQGTETIGNWGWGALLEPFVGLTENTSNALTAFSLGFMISLLIVAIQYLNDAEKVTMRRVLLRPIMGAFSAQLVYLIILSGGSLIWNQASGVSGLSLGVISYIGAVYCEKFEAVTSVTT